MKLFMSIDQITRGHVIANCLEGRCTVQQAALRLWKDIIKVQSKKPLRYIIGNSRRILCDVIVKNLNSRHYNCLMKSAQKKR
ncbi:hypothetical protein [Treponema phagedenis]|uniref:hypothetical protein n=1 Tax=Treponema phagedenis TaxID=162 RepID=UPI0015A6D516|nr:hypothetical protein [Treponema phagedenis]NVP24510.1 hypothetical protein [Treponema phagedenis]